MENFGNIKDTFNNLVVESVTKKDKNKKNIFSKYLNTIKGNKNLTEQFLIYRNLQNTKFDDRTEAKEYVKENIKLLKNLNKKDLREGNEYFLQLLEGKEITKENDSFYQNIKYLVDTKKTSSTLLKINESINNIVDKMLEKEEVVETITEKIDLPTSVLTNLLVNKFNSKYSDISESDKEIIKTILNGTDEDKENIYTKLKRECIDGIDLKLNETSDLEIKDKLLKVKDKLLNSVYNKETFNSDITKFNDLKESI